MVESPKARVARQILRVNHAGEHGAIAIYSAQVARLRTGNPELAHWLQQTLDHEVKHRSAFQTAMQARKVAPCGALAIWSVGGALLGQITGFMGPFGVMVCTAAVERTVHRHLIEQAEFLSGYDDELAATIREIQTEEDEHLGYAEAHHRRDSLVAALLSSIIGGSTELLIYFSTQGSSFGLHRRMQRTTR
jgi:ubiquinone biosynthesis monooxygenase Coq7